MNRVLIGWSAAAFVFGISTLELVNCYSPEMNFLGLTDLRGLSLTQVQILPHYNKFLSRFEKFEERCCGYEKNTTLGLFVSMMVKAFLLTGEYIFADCDLRHVGTINSSLSNR